jgi:hypothetical protein
MNAKITIQTANAVSNETMHANIKYTKETLNANIKYTKRNIECKYQVYKKKHSMQKPKTTQMNARTKNKTMNARTKIKRMNARTKTKTMNAKTKNKTMNARTKNKTMDAKIFAKINVGNNVNQILCMISDNKCKNHFTKKSNAVINCKKKNECRIHHATILVRWT